MGDDHVILRIARRLGWMRREFTADELRHYYPQWVGFTRAKWRIFDELKGRDGIFSEHPDLAADYREWLAAGEPGIHPPAVEEPVPTTVTRADTGPAPLAPGARCPPERLRPTLCPPQKCDDCPSRPSRWKRMRERVAQWLARLQG